MTGRFVEVEDPQGKSVNAGEWIDRKDGLWALRIPMDRPAGIRATNDDRVGQRISIQNNYRAELSDGDSPADPRDSDAPVAAFAPAPISNPAPAIEILKLTPEEVEALRLPGTGMFHGQPGAWYRSGDEMFIGYADIVPDFDGRGWPHDSILKRAMNVIADLKERLKVTGAMIAQRAGDQPTPSHDPEKPDVWLYVIGHARRVGCPVDLITAMEARRALGVQRYGTPLQTFNGRDVNRDLFEEILDATAYAGRRALENDPPANPALALGVDQTFGILLALAAGLVQ